MRITAIVVNYRTPDHVTGLLPTLCDHPSVTRVWVVDNHPLQSFSSGHPKVETIASTANIGFGGAINLALKDTTTDWVLLINPDVRLQEGCIGAMIDAAERYGSPLLGPRFYWDHSHQFRLPPATGGSVWFETAQQCASAHPLERTLLSYYWSTRHDRFWQMNEPFFEPFLSGACMLVDRSRLSLPGGELMDPAFFLYFEDTDLCARAVAGGHRPLCVPQAEAVHYWNQSPEPERSKAELIGESSDKYFRKHFDSFRKVHMTGNAMSPNYEDLGSFSEPFVIGSESIKGVDYCELALNAQFVPFAQACVDRDTFCVNEQVWQQMASGSYYIRTRSGTIGAHRRWMFRKT